MPRDLTKSSGSRSRSRSRSHSSKLSVSASNFSSAGEISTQIKPIGVTNKPGVIPIIVSSFFILLTLGMFSDRVGQFSIENLWKQATAPHDEEPSSEHLSIMILVLVVASASSLLYLRSLTVKNAQEFYASLGVAVKKISRTALEIERKTFHLTGLFVPLLYEFLVRYHNWSQLEFSQFCMCCTLITWIFDGFRVLVPSSINYFPFVILKPILREKELNQLSGTCYFSLGVTISIYVFPPAVSIMSIIWLVLGDMAAALIGVSFGGESCVIKMGRDGKKSVEGSLAMFTTCVILGMFVFSGVYLGEYAVFIGSLAATLVELYEPLGLNDNITIPVLSGLFLQWALLRIKTCSK